jgi:hypothetical protein
MRQEVHGPVIMKSIIFWVVMLTALEFYWRFGGMSVNFYQLFPKLEIGYSIKSVIWQFKAKKITMFQLIN